MDSPTLVRTSDDAVVTLTLNRPQSANALDLELAEALHDQLISAVNDDVPVVLLRGAGAAFCGGGDLRAMASDRDSPAYLRQLAMLLHEGISAISCSESLLVSAVHGVAAGAGLGLVLNSDVVIATQAARFRTSYVAAGLSPDTGVSALLQRAIGEVRAKKMLLLDSPVDAVTALDWGMISEVVADPSLDLRLSELTAQLSRSPAARRTKRLMYEARSRHLFEHLKAEAESIVSMFDSDDSRRRVATFLTRSQPKAT